jgi:hypothetical protein
MTISYNGTAGTAFSMVTSYKVVSTSVSGGITTYKVNVTETLTGVITLSATAAVQSNGNVLWVDELGYNTTLNAGTTFVGLMSPFLAETSLMGQTSLYTSSQFTASSPHSKTFGSTSMQVTDYSPATGLPLTLSGCGYTETISEFSLEVGTVPGTAVTLVTMMHLVATENGSTSIDFTIQVTSITTTQA